MKKRNAISFACPDCKARRNQPCKGSHIPGPNTLGGGWGGPAPRQRPHEARYQVAREYNAIHTARDLVETDASNDVMAKFAASLNEEGVRVVSHEDLEAWGCEAAKRLRNHVQGPISNTRY